MPLPLARLVASAVALCAFAVAVMSGLHADNPADSILIRAILAMVVCYIAGNFVGRVFEHIVRVHLRKIDAATKLAITEADAGERAALSATDETRAAAAAHVQPISEEGAVV